MHMTGHVLCGAAHLGAAVVQSVEWLQAGWIWVLILHVINVEMGAIYQPQQSWLEVLVVLLLPAMHRLTLAWLSEIPAALTQHTPPYSKANSAITLNRGM